MGPFLSLNKTQCTGFILLSLTTGLLMEGALLPLSLAAIHCIHI